MCVSLGDKCYSGARSRMCQTSYFDKSYYKPLTTQLIRYHVNVPSVRSMSLSLSSFQFGLSMPRCFSSQSSGDGAGGDGAGGGGNYYQLYEKLMSQSQTPATPLRSSSVSSPLSTESSRTALSHVGDSGKVKMVDVGSKSETLRVAVAAGRVKLGEIAFQLVVESRLKKGDVLSTAQLAGIMAAKQTGRLIPLCHNIFLTSVDVTLTLDSASLSVVIECTARCCGQTGVELEALTGVSVAALTVYDMCKSVSHDIVISEIQLVSKTGGKSDFSR